MHEYNINRPPPNPPTVPRTIEAAHPKVPSEAAPTREELREMRQRIAVMMAQPSTDETGRASQRDVTTLARMLDRVLQHVLSDES